MGGRIQPDVRGTHVHQATPNLHPVSFLGQFEPREEGQAISAPVALLVLLARSEYHVGVGVGGGQLPTQRGHAKEGLLAEEKALSERL